jgi:hypothetical protein
MPLGTDQIRPIKIEADRLLLSTRPMSVCGKILTWNLFFNTCLRAPDNRA